MWFSNNLYTRATTNKFHYNKFGIIQIGVKALSQTQISNSSLSHKYKVKKPKIHKHQIRIPNTKCKLRTNQRKSHKSNPKFATQKERANHQTVKPKPSENKPLSLFQIATHKYQRTKQEKAFFPHTFSSLFL